MPSQEQRGRLRLRPPARSLHQSKQQAEGSSSAPSRRRQPQTSWKIACPMHPAQMAAAALVPAGALRLSRSPAPRRLSRRPQHLVQRPVQRRRLLSWQPLPPLLLATAGLHSVTLSPALRRDPQHLLPAAQPCPRPSAPSSSLRRCEPSPAPDVSSPCEECAPWLHSKVRCH